MTAFPIHTHCPSCRRVWTVAEIVEQFCISCAEARKEDEKEAA